MNHLLQNTIIQGVISGLISSVIFLSILYFLKPRIIIGDKISSQYVKIKGQDTHVYNFKVINKSLFFKLYDVRVMSYICKELPNTNGVDIHRSGITLLGSGTRTLNRFNRHHYFQNLIRNESTLSTRTDYAAQFSTENNLKNALKNGSYIECQVLAKHSLTGFSKVVTRIFNHESKIIDGTFLSGNSCRIIKKSLENKTIIS